MSAGHVGGNSKNQRMLASILNRQWLKRPLFLGLALALVGLAGISQGRAAAEGAPRLTTMAISVMPEYDQPRVLVSYRGELNADVSLPLQVRLRLPADASIEHVCSIKQPNEEHICQPYSAEPEGQYLAVTWEAVTPTMYVEFYYGSVSGAGQRSLDFTFWAPYPVQNLDLFVLEPGGATDFALSPAPADTVEERGFRHHSYTYQDLSVEEPVTVQMAYTRETDQPSVSPRAAAAGTADSGGIPREAVIFVGLAGAAVLAFTFYRALARRFRIRLATVSGQEPEHERLGTGAAAFFCRHCGHRVREGAVFCPNCGQELRLPGSG